MKAARVCILFSIILSILAVASAFGQAERFTDPDVDYSFDVPDAKWKMTVAPSATSPNVEYVYADRNDGHLEVRRLAVSKDAHLEDIIRVEEQKLQFLPGYVAGPGENFAGRLRGSVFNFEFVRAGKSMGGRFYFLRTADNKVYLLRFTGFRDKLKSIRNQTDSMGRTFDVRKAA
ncbi:MAG: hypothetical protein ABIO91_02605 [Pyrinomonadaceae bacterium]